MDTRVQKEITDRLKRARGQIDGVIAMLDSGRPASKALDRAGYTLIAANMRQCLVADAVDRAMTPEELERLFISLA
jgi:DNA-binding FrmR family transcriptional regulator